MTHNKTALLIAYNRKQDIDEAIALANTAGYEITHLIKQTYLKRPKFGISEKIVEKLVDLATEFDPDVIIYDEVLRPSQNYNLASKIHRNVLDREALILEIFENNASSSESKLQVKLAKMRYELLRAKEKVRLARAGEQPGFLGIGQFEVDVYYNDIKHRMHGVKAKLKKSEKQRALHRQARQRVDFRTVSLAGYTSAGKTTLFNKMTGEDAAESKELFTTLSTTVRRVEDKNKKNVFLLSDTVGFISKLPEYMIEAFRSTLEEMIHTDLVMLVIDSNDQFSTMKKKLSSCRNTLNNLGVDEKKIILIFNKLDLTDDDIIREKIENLKLEKEQKWMAISSKTGANIPKLLEVVNGILKYSQGVSV